MFGIILLTLYHLLFYLILKAWIPLEPHGTDSPITEGIRQKMVTSTQDRINFNLSP